MHKTMHGAYIQEIAIYWALRMVHYPPVCHNNFALANFTGKKIVGKFLENLHLFI